MNIGRAAGSLTCCVLCVPRWGDAISDVSLEQNNVVCFHAPDVPTDFCCGCRLHRALRELLIPPVQSSGHALRKVKLLSRPWFGALECLSAQKHFFGGMVAYTHQYHKMRCRTILCHAIGHIPDHAPEPLPDNSARAPAAAAAAAAAHTRSPAAGTSPSLLGMWEGCRFSNAWGPLTA